MDIYDIAGMGVGPFNLSLASLLDPLKNISSIFLEEKPEFAWHPGMMIEWATIQNSFIKDLVSFTDPTSKHSFISFLYHENRLYEYIKASFKRTTRREFNQYLRWVSKNIETIRWGQKACAISSHESGFKLEYSVKVNSRVVSIRNALAGYKLNIHNLQRDASSTIESDYIVLATGYQQRSQDPLLADIYECVDFDGNSPAINDDYSLAYQGKGKIYALNMAKHSHGINDPNLSLNSWRAGIIINSLVGHEVYRTPQVGSILESRLAYV